MLIDSATIVVRSGKGGDGRVAFRREKYESMGGPNGGDGGKGGSVYLVATAGVDTLLDLTGRHHWSAEDGGDGGIKQRTGADGSDLEIPVPPGTLVYDQAEDKLVEDLDAPGKRLLVARGGKGGYGNEHFKTSTHQAPRFATPGEPAVERQLRLELKLIADVGLVGMPNAGKSTLLSRVSRARPKIADYPFTTLEPQLGIAEVGSVRPGAPGARGTPGVFNARRIVMADLPGLIEGAHHGAGLGIQFLRHIERTRLIVHLLDAAPLDGSKPHENYLAVREELARYSLELAAKPEIVVLSKTDLLDDESLEAVHVQTQKALGKAVMRMSSATGRGLGEVLESCWSRLVSLRSAEGSGSEEQRRGS